MDKSKFSEIYNDARYTIKRAPGRGGRLGVYDNSRKEFVEFAGEFHDTIEDALAEHQEMYRQRVQSYAAAECLEDSDIAAMLAYIAGHSDAYIADNTHQANPDEVHGHGVRDALGVEDLYNLVYQAFLPSTYERAGWKVERSVDALSGAGPNGSFHTSKFERVKVTSPSGETWNF